MESDQKHLTALTNIPPKATSSETSLFESSSSETSSSESSSSSKSSSSSENSSSDSSSSSESSSSESSSSDSDIDEIVNMIKQQRIQKKILKRQAQRKDSEEKCI
jgi:hypothetical protein